MTYNFIKELSESKLVRSVHSYSKYSARDIADLIFLYFLALQILRSDFESAPEASKYARKTIMWSNLNSFRGSSNDLYMLMWCLFGKSNESAIKTLKNQDASRILLANLQFNYTQAKQWLYNIGEGHETSDSDRLFLMKIESMLKIQVSDYRAIRRLVTDWNDLGQSEKEIAMTRLLLAFRARASQSELLPMLEKIAKEQKLEVPVSINPEEPIEKKGTSWKPLAIGAAIGAGLVGKSLYDLFKNGAKGKNFRENIDSESGEN